MGMTEHEHNCPFLNRADERCSKYFHLDQLEHALGHCFDAFEACPVYAERLEERQIRRQVDVLQGIIAQGNLHAEESDRQLEAPRDRRPLIQVTLSTRIAQAFGRSKGPAQSAGYPKFASATEELPALSGV